MVKNSVNYTTLKDTEDCHLETQRIKLFLHNEEITLINAYIPPTSSCSSGYSPDFNALLSDNKKTLLVGDLNSHHPSWHSGCSEDTRGTQLASALEDSQFIVLNSYGNTRAPPGGPESSPDVSAATSDISPCISWQIKKQLSSDHLPIVIDLQHKLQTVKTQKKSIMNLRTADWSKYADALESATVEMTTLDHNADVCKAEKEFRGAIISAARSNIPCGRRPAAIPGLTREITQLMEDRDSLRASLHDNSSEEKREHLSLLNKDIENGIRLEKRDNWREFASSLDRRTPNTKIWKTIKQLDGRIAAAPPNAVVRFKGRAYHKPKALATEFNKQFTTIVRHKTDKETRILNRKLQKLEHNTSQAFDRFNIDNLLRHLLQSTLNPAVTRWLAVYLRGRMARTLFRDATSNAKIVHTGVPQGSCISPCLFNFIMSKMPVPDHPTRLKTYVDDMIIYITSNNIDLASEKITSYLSRLNEFLENNGLILFLEKTAVTLFTPDPRQAWTHPPVAMFNSQLKLEKTPKLLGVTYDIMLTFEQHTANVCKKKLEETTHSVRFQDLTGGKIKKNN